MSGLAMGSGYH